MTLERAARLCWLALLLAGCQCGAADAPPSTVAPAPSSVAPPSSLAPPSSTAPPPTTTIDAGPHALDTADRVQLRAALHEGREAAHAHRYDDALAAFERVITLDPSNRRLRCEAGYVAHLGGHADRAQTLVRESLASMPAVDQVPEALRVETAQCLYNAGLVRQEAGDVEGARAAWTDSLALRPNTVVDAHLHALPPAGTAPVAITVEVGAGATAEAIDTAIVRRLLLQSYRAAWDVDDNAPALAEIARAEVRSVPIDASGGLSVPSNVSLVTAISGAFTLAVLVVHGDAETVAMRVIDLDAGGFGGVLNDSQVASAHVEDLVPGGAPEIVIDVDEEDVDRDMAGCITYSSESQMRFVCTLAPSPGCARIELSHRDDESCDPSCEDDDEEGEDDDDDDDGLDFHCGGDDAPEAGDHPGEPVTTTLTFEGGSAVVAGALAGARAGRYEMAGLIASFPVDRVVVTVR